MLDVGALTGGKAGCTYSTLGGIDTGRIDVRAGAFSLVNLYAGNAP